jgi:hypothetical protein
MENMGDNDILDIINDNLKNKYPNAKFKLIDRQINKYCIHYYTNNINEHYSQNMFNTQDEYLQNDIKNYLRELINLYFDRDVLIENEIIFIL